MLPACLGKTDPWYPLKPEVCGICCICHVDTAGITPVTNNRHIDVLMCRLCAIEHKIVTDCVYYKYGTWYCHFVLDCVNAVVHWSYFCGQLYSTRWRNVAVTSHLSSSHDVPTLSLVLTLSLFHRQPTTISLHMMLRCQDLLAFLASLPMMHMWYCHLPSTWVM